MSDAPLRCVTRIAAGLLLLGLTMTSTANAQPTSFLLDELRARDEAAQRRAADQANQLQALETRLRAEQAISDLARPAPTPPTIGPPTFGPPTLGSTAQGPVANMPTLTYPAISDAALAASNRRVRAASRTPD